MDFSGRTEQMEGNVQVNRRITSSHIRANTRVGIPCNRESRRGGVTRMADRLARSLCYGTADRVVRIVPI